MVRVEGSMSNAYLVKEATSFCSYYFEDHVRTSHEHVQRNDDGVVAPSYGYDGTFSIFTHPGRPFGRPKKRYLTPEEYVAGHRYVLVNYPKISPYLR